MYEVSAFKKRYFKSSNTPQIFIAYYLGFLFHTYELSIKINCLNLMSFFWLAKVKSAELRISRQG